MKNEGRYRVCVFVAAYIKVIIEKNIKNFLSVNDRLTQIKVIDFSLRSIVYIQTKEANLRTSHNDQSTTYIYAFSFSLSPTISLYVMSFSMHRRYFFKRIVLRHAKH